MLGNSTRNASIAQRASFLAAAVCLLASGCGEDKFPIRPAKGKVLCGGRPVGIGSISFTPIGTPGSIETGKPASGALKEDGTFILTTNDRFDGAIVGKHNVQYVGPEGGDEEDTSAAEGSPEERAKAAERAKERKAQMKSLCVQKGEIILEVTADGENDFTIELSQAGSAR
ncbi:MAG TPA: hypothetical protein VM452_14085 [Caulifigura sp.]|nr:hypothetical protein [Caulifigura sp.]